MTAFIAWTFSDIRNLCAVCALLLWASLVPIGTALLFWPRRNRT